MYGYWDAGNLWQCQIREKCKSLSIDACDVKRMSPPSRVLALFSSSGTVWPSRQISLGVMVTVTLTVTVGAYFTFRLRASGFGYGNGYERAYFTYKDLCPNRWPQYYFRLQASGFRLQASGFRRGFRLQASPEASGMGLFYILINAHCTLPGLTETPMMKVFQYSLPTKLQVVARTDLEKIQAEPRSAAGCVQFETWFCTIHVLHTYQESGSC